jgi:hypothetical protein
MQQLQSYFEKLNKTKDFMEIIAHAMCLATAEPQYAAQAQEFLTEKYKTKNVDTFEFLQNMKEVQTVYMTNKAPLLGGDNKPHKYWFENGIVI